MPLPGTHNTIQLAIALDAARHELGIALLSLEGIVSFQEEDGLLLAYLPEQSWNPEKERAARAALQRLPGVAPGQWEASFIAERNWNEEWEAHLKPIEISDRFLIAQKKERLRKSPARLCLPSTQKCRSAPDTTKQRG